MSRKVKPNLFRLGVTTTWPSCWFYKKSLKFFLEEDCLIREIVYQKFSNAGIAGIDIERTREDISVSIKSNRPGLVIGRRGKGIEELRETVIKGINNIRREKGIDLRFNLNVSVIEMRRTELSAPVIARQIAFDLERRLPYRLVMKRHLHLIKQNRDIKGAKIRVSGRLNGAEIARSEWRDFGRMPLQTLRADIDYGEAVARTTYGAIGVKIWLYKGEIFSEINDVATKEAKI